jgi:hypothetical protein
MAQTLIFTTLSGKAVYSDSAIKPFGFATYRLLQAMKNQKSNTKNQKLGLKRNYSLTH